jgi:hypothetical protein
MAYSGKLVEVKISNSWTNIPMKYMAIESYKVTPNQRMESSANRAIDGVLRRQTVAHTATKIEFTTPPLTNSDVNALNTLLTSAFTDSLQRKLSVKYYNPSSDTYETGTFYMPDVEYPINRVDNKNNIIHYNPLRFAFIEY